MCEQSNDTPEQWLSVVGYEGWYEVSDLGRVRRIRAGRGVKVGRILHDHARPDGRRCMTLNKQRVMRTHLIHRLVALAFHPLPDYPCEVNHIDGNPANNRADNLEWVTRGENEHHKYTHLGYKPTNAVAQQARRKLAPEQVREIRAAIGISQEELGRRYGVDQTTISKVRLRQTYSHIN